jgi:hypothetical protein
MPSRKAERKRFSMLRAKIRTLMGPATGMDPMKPNRNPMIRAVPSGEWR